MPLQRLPTELQQLVVFFATQEDLLALCLASRHLNALATRYLYRRLYLNDSHIETSTQHALAPNWSFFPLERAQERGGQANVKLQLLTRSLRENTRLPTLVHEVRLNWDLDIALQTVFISVLTQNSPALRYIDNVTDPRINAVINSSCEHRLLSLDLPPPKPLPSLEIPRQYIPGMRQLLGTRLSAAENSIRTVTLFMDPLLMFNGVFQLQKKLELDSLKLHCRSDTYPPSLYNRATWKHHHLRDIFDTESLKTLTIISWYDHPCPDKVYKLDQWAEFKNLQDITLIAVTYNDQKIANMINSCHQLKRLKLDFTVTLKWMPASGEVYHSIFKHKDWMEFLDIKVQQTHRVVSLDIREFKIVVRAPCSCSLCQQTVVKDIFKGKILTREEDYTISDASFDTYERANFYDMLQSSNIFPYSKAVDHYPSVRTGPEDPESLIFKFNEINEDRDGYVPLTMDDFLPLHHCLIHTLQTDIEPFMKQFNKLKFLVYNEVSFVIKDVDQKRFAMPLFYTEGFEPNFWVDIGAPGNSDSSAAGSKEKVYDRAVYLN